MTAKRPLSPPPLVPLSEQEVKTSETFLQFTYPETKDLAKQFITVVSAVLAVSLTFSDRVVKFATAGKLVRAFMLSSWALSILAILSGGIAIFLIFNAGLMAKYEATFRYRYEDGHGPRGGRALGWMTIGGICFVLSLAALVCAELLAP